VRNFILEKHWLTETKSWVQTEFNKSNIKKYRHQKTEFKIEKQ